MAVTPHKPSGSDADLEATDELPILELALPADGETATLATIDSAALPDLSDSLRDVENHLKRKTERLRELEGLLSVADAERKELRSDLDSERRAAAEQLAAERRSSAELLQRERTVAAEQLDHERRAATAQLEAERRSAVELLERTRQEAQANLESERTAARLAAEELAGKLAAAGQSLSGTRDTLESSNTELAATRARLADHEQLVAELRRTSGIQASDLRNQGRDLAELRHRAERQHEALRHSQGFRGVLEGLLSDREQALSIIEARHAAELAAKDSSGASQLQESAEREAALKSEAAVSVATMQSAHEQRLQQLSAEHVAREAALAEKLELLRAETAAQITGLENELRQQVSDLALTKQQLEASGRQGAELATELELRRGEIAGQQAELAGLRETDEAARAGIEVFQQQSERVRALETDLAQAREQVARLDEALRESEEQKQRLESEARASVSLLGNLQQDIARLGREDTGAKPVLKLVSPVQLPGRQLVSDEDGKEVVHTLGRRTSIGRTPDNDIQIDASYVSRHHAVILSSAQHCIIEDLNSMNGVLVNGRRISRHALRDGDVVAIGKSVFRFRQPA
jgi:chromosome segregation ATPase